MQNKYILLISKIENGVFETADLWAFDKKEDQKKGKDFIISLENIEKELLKQIKTQQKSIFSSGKKQNVYIKTFDSHNFYYPFDAGNKELLEVCRELNLLNELKEKISLLRKKKVSFTKWEEEKLLSMDSSLDFGIIAKIDSILSFRISLNFRLTDIPEEEWSNSLKTIILYKLQPTDYFISWDSILV